MRLEELRLKHPRLVYRSYDILSHEDETTITYNFLLEPDIWFHPTITIPHKEAFDSKLFENFIFHMGLLEAVSYWKLACPRELVIEAGPLGLTGRRFIEDLFLHGLGEFYYANGIDFTTENFVTILSTSEKDKPAIDIATKPIDLVLVGGGKDSALLLSLLAKSGRMMKPLVVNPSTAALEIISSLGLSDPIVVTRTLDPKLLELNKIGYLNGHTPFSALLSFIGVTVAAMYGYENVMVANEQSANEGNVLYKGIEINHQYSKSLRYENLFRAYAHKVLTPSISYFSAMRPFHDIQISKMFSRVPELLLVFRSCNTLRTTNMWCGDCAKCAFTYLTLFPFVTYEKMMQIFGDDYYKRPAILQFIRELVGVISVKPFECVGTREEAKLALLLSLQSYKQIGREIPEGLLRIKTEAGLQDGDVTQLSLRSFDHISDMHNVPDEHLTLIMDAWTTSQEKQ